MRGYDWRMESTDRDEAIAKLDRLEAEIRDKLREKDLAADGDERSDGHHHPAEAATDAEARERQLREVFRLRDQLERLQRARLAIDAGTYGICADCGEAIPEGRLRALPDAERCVACQSAAGRRR